MLFSGIIILNFLGYFSLLKFMNGQFQYLISLAFDYSKIAESENQCYLYFIIHVLRKLSTFE